MGIGQLIGLDGTGVGQELFSSRATPAHNPGFLATDGFGNVYAYAKAGAGAALVAGNVVQAPAQVTDHDQLTPVAAEIGDTQVTVALGATAATVNQYAGGKLVVDTTPGLGQDLLIEGHLAADLSTSVIIKLGQPLRVALTTTSRVTLAPNKFVGVIQAPATTLTGAPVGIAIHPIAAGEWGWIGKDGEFGVLISGTPAVGAAVVSPSGTAGAAAVDPADAAVTIIGSMMVTGVSGKVLPVAVRL